MRSREKNVGKSIRKNVHFYQVTCSGSFSLNFEFRHCMPSSYHIFGIFPKKIFGLFPNLSLQLFGNLLEDFLNFSNLVEFVRIHLNLDLIEFIRNCLNFLANAFNFIRNCSNLLEFSSIYT